MLGTARGTGLCKAFSSLIPKKLGEGPATTGDPGGEESAGQGGRGHVGWDPGAPLPPASPSVGRMRRRTRSRASRGRGAPCRTASPVRPSGPRTTTGRRGRGFDESSRPACHLGAGLRAALWAGWLQQQRSTPLLPAPQFRRLQPAAEVPAGPGPPEAPPTAGLAAGWPLRASPCGLFSVRTWVLSSSQDASHIGLGPTLTSF